jgi:hypothetical protein
MTVNTTREPNSEPGFDRDRHSEAQYLKNLKEWTNRLHLELPAYKPPEGFFTMLTPYELCMLESYARELFTGSGRIIDLGCWCGGTTASLASGLRHNKTARGNRVVESFDIFKWEAWMDPIANQINMPSRYNDGDIFAEDVEKNLHRYAGLFKLIIADLATYVPEREGIEFLFVDAMKDWRLADQITREYFPLLLPGQSIVVQQDFAFYSSIVMTNHLVMWYFRDYFEPIYHVPYSCSVLFYYKGGISRSAIPPIEPAQFTLPMIQEAGEFALSVVDPTMHASVKVTKLCYLINRRYFEAARSELAQLDGANAEPHLKQAIRDEAELLERCSGSQKERMEAVEFSQSLLSALGL